MIPEKLINKLQAALIEIEDQGQMTTRMAAKLGRLLMEMSELHDDRRRILTSVGQKIEAVESSIYIETVRLTDEEGKLVWRNEGERRAAVKQAELTDSTLINMRLQYDDVKADLDALERLEKTVRLVMRSSSGGGLG